MSVSALSDLSLAQDSKVIPSLRINPTRLQQNLEALSVYGRPAGGTFADGVSRVAYSDAALRTEVRDGPDARGRA